MHHTLDGFAVLIPINCLLQQLCSAVTGQLATCAGQFCSSTVTAHYSMRALYILPALLVVVPEVEEPVVMVLMVLLHLL